MTSPADIIRPGAAWTPGAWTPARCAQWRELDGDTRQRLEQWVYTEGRRRIRHRTQLPAEFMGGEMAA